MRPVWSPRATLDLVDIRQRIASENPAAARVIAQKIKSRVLVLEDFPSIGRVGRAPGTRELVVAGTPFVIAYRSAQGRITILRVLHGARSWPSIP
ncbi:MAG: type II toxin-antitoxin system RelE/ParE family toxin [Bauldia sp.]